LLCTFARSSVAADLYWDLNGTGAGAGGTAPSGLWNTTSNFWNTDPAGTAIATAWGNNGTTAVFSAGTDAFGAYTVTLANNAGISANGIRVEDGSVTIAPGTGSTLFVNGPIDVAAGHTGTFMQSVGGFLGLNKIGGGVAVLGAANAVSGPTVVNNGTLSLDFSQSGAPASDLLVGPPPLVLSSAFDGAQSSTLAMIGKASTANAQNFSATTIGLGAAIISATSGSGGSATLNLGAISRDAGGIVNFIRPASGGINTTSGNVNGILGGWATVGTGQTTQGVIMGTDWASVDGSGNIVTYTGYTDLSSGTMHGNVTPASNVRISQGTVQVDANGAGTTTDVNTIKGIGFGIGTGNTLRLGRYGAIFKSAINTNNETIGSTQDAGTITAGGAPNQSGEINFIVNNTSQSTGSLLVEAAVKDNGSGAVTVIKSGPGSMKFRGHNSYSGGTYVLQGRFQLAGREIGTVNPDGFGIGPVYVRPGGQAYLSSVGLVGPTNDFFIAGTGTNQEPFGALRLGNFTLSTNNNFAGKVTLVGDARIAGESRISDTGICTFAGQITGPFNLEIGTDASFFGIFDGSSIVLGNPANDWGGDTTLVCNGLYSIVTLGASQVIPDGPGKGNLRFGGAVGSGGTATLDLNGFNETVNGLSSNTNNTYIVDNRKSGTLSTLTIGNNDQSSTFAGSIRNSVGTAALTKTGAGTQTLTRASTYTGATTINGGTLLLDFAAQGAATINILGTGSRLVLSSMNDGAGVSRIQMNGKAIANNTQTFAGTVIGPGYGVIAVSAGTGGTAGMSLGALTRNPVGVVTFLPPAVGPINTTATLTNNILGGWATIAMGQSSQTSFFASDWATVNAFGDVVPYTGYTDFNSGGPTLHSTATPATNLRIVSGVPQVDADGAGTITDLNTIKGGSFNIGLGNTLRLGRFGGIFRSDTASSNEQVGGGQNVGTLTAGGAPNTPGEIVFTINNTSQSTGSELVDVAIADNGSGAVTLIKTGPGSMKLRGHNAYSGGTYVLQGRLQLAGIDIGTGNPDGLGTGPVYVRPGGQAFFTSTDGAGIANDFYLAGTGTNQEPFGAIRVGAGVNYFLGRITLVGDARIGGSSAGAGTFAGQITGPRSLELGNPSLSTALVFTNPANDWAGNTTLIGGTLFSLGASGVLPDGPGKGDLLFTSSSNELDLNGFDETINGLSGQFSTTNFVDNRRGATIATLSVGGNNATSIFGGTIRDGSGSTAITKIGAGTLTLNGVLEYSGPTTVQAGTLVLGTMHLNWPSGSSMTVAGGSAIFNFKAGATPPHALSVNASGGDVTFIASQSLDTLTIGANRTATVTPDGSRVLELFVLNVHPQGKLDLTNNQMIITGGDAGSWDGSAYTAIAGLVAAGRNGGTWDGHGIVGAGFTADGVEAKTLGVANGSEVASSISSELSLLDEVALAASDVFVLHTWAGDADLNGVIDSADFARINANMGTTSPTYAKGDFNYDGAIDSADMTIINTNFARQNIPEPTSAMGLLAISWLMKRRRRTRP
jgi:fibronectin-binding autotransporter adhesin